MAWGTSPASLEWTKRLKANDPTFTSLFVMKFRKLVEKDWQDLCESLSDNNKLQVYFVRSNCSHFWIFLLEWGGCKQELMASGHALSDPVLSSFSEMLKTNTGLRRLGLGDETFGDRGVSRIAPGLAANHGLRDLELDYKGIGPEGAAALATVCARCGTPIRRPHHLLLLIVPRPFPSPPPTTA